MDRSRALRRIFSAAACMLDTIQPAAMSLRLAEFPRSASLPVLSPSACSRAGVPPARARSKSFAPKEWVSTSYSLLLSLFCLIFRQSIRRLELDAGFGAELAIKPKLDVVFLYLTTR